MTLNAESCVLMLGDNILSVLILSANLLEVMAPFLQIFQSKSIEIFLQNLHQTFGQSPKTYFYVTYEWPKLQCLPLTKLERLDKRQTI
jgi:hypothetical protein